MKRILIALATLAVALTVNAAKPVTIKGSDTMVIMNARLAEAFMAKSPGTTIQVTGGGSGVGIAALINGTTDIAASSRPIRTSETNSLKQRFATLGHAVPIARDVNAVANDANGIGYGGAAYAKGIRFAAVKKDANSPAYVPTLETVRGGQYPITRYLYLYLRNKPSGDAKKFIDWATSDEGQRIVSQVGYFPIR